MAKRNNKKPSAGSAIKSAPAASQSHPGDSRRSGKSGQKAKRKRRRKIETADRVWAVVVAAVIILIAALASFAGFYLHSAKIRNETLTQAVEEPVTVSPAPPARPEPAAQVPGQSSPPVRTNPAVQTPGQRPESVQPEPERTVVSPAPGGVTEHPPLPSRSLKTEGSLVFVIDDAGNNLRDLEPFLNFPGPLTIAVLPGLPYSAEAARRIRSAGKEVFLHQPMESIGGHNPGPGAIYSGMGSDEIRAIINRNLDEIWPVAGMNNHEGSRISMDDEAMETILSVCRERGIVFLDSRTTAETAAPRAARRLGMVIGERDIFVDNVQEVESMVSSINTGLSRAGQNGSVIMIGHVWSPDLAPLLIKLVPDLTGQGYAFATASEVIRGTGQ